MRKLAAAFAAFSMLTAAPAPAQDFSTKPIRILVGLSAGGAVDTTARLIGQKLSENLKTSVLVENRPGGLFVPVMKELTAAEPDGHTLYIISTSSLVSQPLHPDIPYDLRNFTPITQISSGPLILVARKDLPINNLQELIEADRKNPGKLTFASGGGTGSSFYLATELLKSKTGIKPVHVPYKGAGPALNDLLGGHVDLMFDAMPVMAAQVKMGRVKPIAVTSVERSPAVPDVPTVIEQGVPEFEVAGWFGLLGPPNMPLARAKALRDEVARAVAAPDVVAQLDAQGTRPIASEPAEWGAYIRQELDRWGKVIKDANIKAE
jgi:tripartite-type tricarboxylate transporter receptor subunit TctC